MRDKRSMPTAAKLPKKKMKFFPFMPAKRKKNKILIQSIHKKFYAGNNARIHNAQTEFFILLTLLPIESFNWLPSTENVFTIGENGREEKAPNKQSPKAF